MAKPKSKKAPSKRSAKTSDYRTLFLTFLKSIYAFPVGLFILVLVLSGLKIHGSSVGMFNEHLYGENYKDSSLLFGRPRAIRSDEWLSNTPMTVSQSYNNFPVVNKDVGPGDNAGHDMTVVKDFPTKSWESIFKPQNWGFFVVPIENAFAYRWLILSFLLIISVYFFVLELFPGRRDLAILLAGVLYFTPFLHWWYLYTSFGSVFYTLFALIFLMRLHKSKSHKAKIAWASGITFVGVGLALILYPPFQLSAALAGAFFYVGWVLHHFNLRKKVDRLRLIKDLSYIGVALAIAVAFLYAYYTQHKEVIRAIMDSEHPGARRVFSGDRNWAYFVHEFSSQLQYRLQFPRAGLTYYANQSESANFILFAPFLMVPSWYIIFKDWRKKLKPDYPIILLNVLLVLLLVRQHIPHTDILFKPFALNRVPNYRLLLGIGVGQFLLLVSYYRRNISDIFKSKYEQGFLALVALSAFGSFLWTGMYTAKHYSKFISNRWEVILAALVMSGIVYMIIRGWRLGLLALVVFSAFSVVIINPVYRGLGPLLTTPVAKEIQRVSDRTDLWAVMEDIRFENVALSSGRPSMTALYSYPRKDLWKPLDRDGVNQTIYNRSAHVVFFNKPQLKQSQLIKLAINKFGVLLNPCSDYPKEIGLDFMLTTMPIDSKCAKHVSTVPYPAVTFYIYKLEY
jgi:hypothetical protein